MLHVPERELLKASKARASWVETSAHVIRWFAGVPMALILIYGTGALGVPILGFILYPPLGWVLKKFSTYIAQAGMAAIVIAALNWVFNYPFTALIVWQFPNDPVLGTIVWSAAGLILNYGCVVWYKRTETDYFGFEWLRMQETIESKSWKGRAIRFCLKNSRFLAFGVLSLFSDPIYGFIYQRGRQSGPRFTAHDWYWFALANVIGMLPWILGAYGIAGLVDWAVE